MDDNDLNVSPHLLIVDDDRELRELLSRYLKQQGYRVDVVRDGREMWRVLEDWHINLVVLDLMLPGEDGLSLCRSLRAKSGTPIIMLTAKREEADRVVGLEMGADDYLTKPFGPRELLARIRAVLRRTETVRESGVRRTANILRFAGWTLNLPRRQLESPEGMVVDLTDGEFDLLVAFADHPQRVLSRDQLLDLARGRSAVPFDRSVDVQVGRLRRKIEPEPDHPRLIKTVRGHGYVFTPDVEHQ